MRLRKPAVLKRLAVVAVLIVATLGILYSVNNTEFKRQLTLATTRQPQHLTELFFEEPAKLPGSAPPGQTVPITFVIRNHELQNMQYPYQVTFTNESDEEAVLLSDTVGIGEGLSYTVTRDIVVPSGEGRGEVGVQLLNKNQSIHFWLERI